MNFMLSIIKFTKFKPITKFKKFELHNRMHANFFADLQGREDDVEGRYDASSSVAKRRGPPPPPEKSPLRRRVTSPEAVAARPEVTSEVSESMRRPVVELEEATADDLQNRDVNKTFLKSLYSCHFLGRIAYTHNTRRGCQCQRQCQSKSFNVAGIAELLQSPRRRSRAQDYVGKD